MRDSVPPEDRMPDHDAWARGLDDKALATGVRSLTTKLPARHRTDEILALVREAARRIERKED